MNIDIISYKHKYYKYKHKYINLLKQTGGKKNNKKNMYDLNKILGSLYGVCVGDSLGSRYEFLNSVRSTDLVEQDVQNSNGVVKILGGGPFNLSVGQLSDDSEMMLSLLESIFNKRGYDQEDVANKYIQWFNSNPVDVGNTIKKSLFTRRRSESNLDMVRNSRELNNTSLSNGVLMRVAPIGVLGLKITDKELERVVSMECDLTHPNDIIKDAVYMYILAIKYVLLGKSKKFIYKLLMEKVHEPRVKIVIKDSQEQPEPTYMIDELGKDIYVRADNKRYQGYFGTALQITFYEFFNGTSFTQSMIDIIKKGGDVDTNCAIAGGLLGAYYGLSNIDKNLVTTVRDADNSRVKEYPFLSPKVIDNYVKQMFIKKQI